METRHRASFKIYLYQNQIYLMHLHQDQWTQRGCLRDDRPRSIGSLDIPECVNNNNVCLLIVTQLR